MTYAPLPSDVLDEIRNRFREADKHLDAGAMTLATADSDGRPSVRTMTIRVFDEQGFVFLSSNISRKGLDLAVNPAAALCAYWPPLKLQITINGSVVQLDQAHADRLWSNRSRENHLAAWASQQSQELVSSELLVERLEALKHQYRGTHIPRPDTWQAYRLVPDRIEFWSVGWQRLHERICHFRENDVWQSVRLQP
ncbi:MAG: pyridoxal 5'-phosphate synthase [Gammaproteobacteria bacterium]|nr:pyridoxal 5'-phosphate synthase [Gammaproteobacteria bacterium]